jgi:hypothetical protein
VLHGVSRVGITARVYDGATGKLLFESMHEQVKNQGELKIPAGYLAVLAGPILGLQHIHMADMCRNVSLHIGEDMRRLGGAADGKPAATDDPAKGAPSETSGAASKAPAPR